MSDSPELAAIRARDAACGLPIEYPQYWWMNEILNDRRTLLRMLDMANDAIDQQRKVIDTLNQIVTERDAIAAELATSVRSLEQVTADSALLKARVAALEAALRDALCEMPKKSYASQSYVACVNRIYALLGTTSETDCDAGREDGDWQSPGNNVAPPR